MDQICLELARRRLYEKIRYFQPNGGQERFIAEIARPGGFIILNGSGNGGGKSFVIVALCAAVMWPALASPAFSAPIFQKWPHPKRIRIVSTPKEVEEIGAIQTAIQELWPRDRYEAMKKGKNYPSQFKSDTRFVVDVMTYEQDPSEFAGPTLGLVIFNEPPPKAIYDESLARLRRGGFAIGAMTGLNENPWIADVFAKADGDKIRAVFADVEENCKQHGKNGTLEHEQIEKILAQYDPDEREARKTGRPLSISGRIYKVFDRAVHVAKEIIVPPTEGVTHYQVVDPAIGKPLAVIYAYVDAAGAVCIYDEHPDFEFHGARDSNLTVADYIKLFKAKESGRAISIRIMDRHFGNVRRTMGGKTLKEEFDDEGCSFQDSYGDVGEAEVETGILKVKDYLAHDKTKAIDGLNRPKLIISPNCVNTIQALERWGRDPKTRRPKEDYKDFADVVRYLCMAEPAVETASSWTPKSGGHYGVNTNA